MGWIDKFISPWPASVQCAFWIIVSGTLTTSQLGIVRLIADHVNVFEIVFLRAVFSLLFIAPLLVGNAAVLLRPVRLGICILCGALAFLANVGFYFAAKFMPLADIMAIHFLRPLCAAILAGIFLKEFIGGSRAIALVAGLIGAVIIIRPGLVDLNIGVFFVLGVVVVQSWNPINRRLLAKSEHPDTIAVWNPLVIFPLACVPAIFVWTTPTLAQIGWIAVIGILEMLNQRVLGRAYVQGEAVVVVALHYTRLPIAALIGFLMFGDVPEIWIWIGGAVIAGAAIYLAKREAAASRKPD
ncbi:MAG: DMT family transporter [Rhodospirillaceae bacterium]|jgi:drug/metabolite transporter (DMT)-like permease|nr:DMT family transporter [Rhodospirillaceae bacterium]MBT5458792.1 DMT family transporter [Rhodospirillaceae bacterium]